MTPVLFIILLSFIDTYRYICKHYTAHVGPQKQVQQLNMRLSLYQSARGQTRLTSHHVIVETQGRSIMGNLIKLSNL